MAFNKLVSRFKRGEKKIIEKNERLELIINILQVNKSQQQASKQAF